MLSINKGLVLLSIVLCLYLIMMNIKNNRLEDKLKEQISINKEQVITINNLKDDMKKLESINKELNIYKQKTKQNKEKMIKKALNEKGSDDKLDEYFVDIFCSLHEQNNICRKENIK